MSDDHMYPERDRTSGTHITAHDPVADIPLRQQTRASNQESLQKPPRGSTAVFTELPLLTIETSRLPLEIRHQTLGVSINCLPGIVTQIRNRNRAQDDDVLPVSGPATDGRNPPIDGEFPYIRNR